LSHGKERKENNCLNCNAIVQGKFCHICGQENKEPKESALQLVTHFFEDITHFDGKFFSSLKLLLFKPGFLSTEYMVGRRASHLNPIRMYVFASAIFFLIFFSIFHYDAKEKKTTLVNNVPLTEIIKMDSAKYKVFVDTLIKSDTSLKFAYDKIKYLKYIDSISGKGFSIGPSKYKSKAEYDSALAHGKKHNWVERQLTYKQIEIKEKYKDNNSGVKSAFVNALLHSLPQLLFISLPLFALLLKLLYYRQKKYYYVNHAIFTIYLFVFVFITLLFVFGLNKIQHFQYLHWVSYVSGFLIFLIFFYNYKAMRHFYQQRRAKTILKFCLLHFFNLFIVIILFTIFTFLSLFKI
jgi:hypothetical protein